MNELIKAGEHRGVNIWVRKTTKWAGRLGHGQYYAQTGYMGGEEGSYRTGYYGTAYAAAVDAIEYINLCLEE